MTFMRGAAVVAACLLAPAANAQDAAESSATPLSDQLFAKGVSPDALVDPAVQPAQGLYDPGMDAGADYGWGSPPAATTRPVSWISGPYFKLGPSLIMGGGLLDTRDVGWSVSGGYRVPWGPAFDERLFLDFGGSYLSAYGETARPTIGDQTSSGVETQINMETRLQEVKRGGVHAAIGWYWGDVLDSVAGDPQVRFATRIGGRWSHVRGKFEDIPLAFPPVGAVITNTSYGKTCTTGGLFVGTEAILLRRDTAIGSVLWTIDGEFSNDWVEFDDFESGSLGTASVMLGFMLSR